MTYGATPEEWIYWDLYEGLTEDLLPVVCQPGQKIYEKSNLVAYGKVPSRYTVRREVVGVTNWTSHVASDDDLALWAIEPDYGICLQTRRVRALDFDITETAYATYLKDSLELLGYAFPWRTRSNSSKFLTLFYLEGDYGKQTLQTPHGIIEFLATGQQCVVAGTHPSGVRYQWDWRHPIPTLGPGEFRDLLGCLENIVETGGGVRAKWSDPARSRVVDRDALVDGRVLEDPVLDYLRVHELVLRSAPDGRAFLRCPWADAHTSASDLTATCYFPAETANFEQGHFKCLHAHCQEREDWEFLREIGYDAEGFEVIGPPIERAEGVPGLAAHSQDLGDAVHRAWSIESQRDLQSEAAQDGDTSATVITALGRLDADAGLPDGVSAEVLTALGASEPPKHIVSVDHPLDLPNFERDKHGNVKPKLSNIVLALRRPDLVGAVIGRDEFKDEIAWRHWTLRQPYFPTSDLWNTSRSLKDADYVGLQLTLGRWRFGPAEVPYDALRRGVNYIAEERLFDSAINWLETLPEWDGVSRIDTFCPRYLGTEDTPYTRAVGRYWWTAHIGRVVVPGLQCDMAMVLISEQGTRKTSVLKYMVPNVEHYVELDLVERDENLSRKMRGKLIGELAELRGINSKDIESIKAWISRQREEWVPKYLEFSRSFPRRLVLVGTSNQDEFLADETGNRRWLPMRVGCQDIDAVVRDRDQLWAEAYGLYLFHGLLWGDAERLGKAEHLHYMIHDDWETTIQRWLVTDDGFGGGRPADREYLSAGDILRDALGLAVHQTNMSTQFRVGKILRKLGYVKFHKRIDGELRKIWQKVHAVWGARED